MSIVAFLILIVRLARRASVSRDGLSCFSVPEGQRSSNGLLSGRMHNLAPVFWLFKRSRMQNGFESLRYPVTIFSALIHNRV